MINNDLIEQFNYEGIQNIVNIKRWKTHFGTPVIMRRCALDNWNVMRGGRVKSCDKFRKSKILVAFMEDNFEGKKCQERKKKKFPVKTHNFFPGTCLTK